MSSANPEVIKLYNQIAEVLSKYRSGRLPQHVHNIPLFDNWFQLLKLTRPET